MQATFKRHFYLYAGWLSFALGSVGMFVPLLPTTVFWILAVWCWARSCPVLMERVYAHPRFGHGVKQFLEHGVISRRGKHFATGGMTVSFLIFVLLVQPYLVLALIVGVTLALVALWIVTRPEKPSRHPSPDDQASP